MLLLATTLAGCPSSPRDVVPETRDVRVTDDAGARSTQGGYAFVEKRPHGAIGVAGMMNLDEAGARAIVVRLADELESCAKRLEEQGTLAEGAAQYTAGTGPRGTGEIGQIKLAPGNAVAANSLLCIVAPVRAAIFPPPAEAGVPALLLEATWGPVHGGKAAATPDGGG